MEVDKKTLRSLRMMWLVLWWLGLLSLGLNALIALFIPMTKMLALALGFGIFNLFACDWWIKRLDTNLEELE